LSEHRLGKRVLTLSILILASLIASTLPITHAQPTYSDNIVGNGDFETIRTGTTDQPAIWTTEFLDSNAGSTITLNSTQALLGIYSARLDVSQDTHSAKNASQAIGFGHQTLRQQFPANFLVSNLTARPDSINLWYMIQPKFAGYSGLDVRIKAGDTTEMNYIFTNPQTGISASNSSTGGEAGKPVKYILIPTPNMNQWTHLSRDLEQDWLAPMTNSNGVMPGRFAADQTIVFIEIWSFYYQDPFSLAVFGETEWVDNVAIYIDSATPPQPPPPHNNYAAFNFRDTTGALVNNLVSWKLFNSTGEEIVGYTQNSQTLILEPYTVAVYYPIITGQNPEPYLIGRQRIVLNTTYNVSLEMFPQGNFPWSYVAFNSTITNLKIVKENATFLQFDSLGDAGPALILVKVQSKPLVVQRNLDDPTSLKWSYDPSLFILRIPAIGLGNFSIFITPPVTIPQIAFQDFTGNSVSTGITWKILLSDGTQLTVVPGQLIENGTYTYQAFYSGYLIYTNILTSTPNPIRLQMLPIGTQRQGYIAFNSTIASITVLENSATQLGFRAEGHGSYLIIVNSHIRPLSVSLNGNNVTSWTYNSSTSTIAIQTSQLGTFTITYSNTPAIPILYIGAIIGAVAIAVAGLLIWRKTHSKTLNQPSPFKGDFGTKEQPGSKTQIPQKGQLGRL